MHRSVSTRTVGEAVDHWLKVKRGQIRQRTLSGYLVAAKHIRGPLLSGTSRQRAEHTLTGEKPEGAKLINLIGEVRLSELTTADIRAWHMTLQSEVSLYAATRAKMCLAAALALAEEDFGVRTPRMPTRLGRGRHKLKKPILTSEQIKALLEAARADKRHGIYYAFPFLAGTRPSEQLALLWEDVDLEAELIRIRRTQENDGTIVDLTKTEAGRREVPMCSTLREMLLEWRVACPRRGGELYRVFPGPGRLAPWLKAPSGRRRPPVPELQEPYMGARAEAARTPVRDPSLGATLLHLNTPGAGHRGGASRQARRAFEPRGDARALHTGSAGRRGGSGSARARVLRLRVTRTRHCPSVDAASIGEPVRMVASPA